MLEGLSIPLALKMCAAAVVVGGAGVATVEVVSSDSDASSVVVEAPDSLGFADGTDSAAADIERSAAPQDKSDADVEEKVINDDASDGDKIDASEDKDPDLKDSALNGDEVDKSEKEKTETDAAVQVDVSILWPEDNSHHEKANVVFEGKVSAGAQVFAGPYEADVDDDGHWRIELILSPGANKATITAKDASGNIAEDAITAWLDVEEKPVEKEEPTNVEFSANQKYGSCEEPTPYDVFWGTAKPNSVVQISSPYGSATVEVGKKGHWEKKVFFETAPRGQAFAVTVTAENGSKTFEFLAKAIEEPHKDAADK